MKILCIIVGVFIALCILDTLRSFILLRKGTKLADNAIPYSQEGNGMNILVLGDSTAVGTGVKDNQDSTAGRLGQKYKDAKITNLAKNGLRLEGLKEIINTQVKDEHYDLILVQIGANDIIRMKSMEDIETDIREILTSLRADKIIVLHSGNIGEAKFFPFYIRGILTKRSREARDIYTKVAKETNREYVNLFDSPIAKLLKEEPTTYYAEDYLHLTGEGYGLWFDEIEKHI